MLTRWKSFAILFCLILHLWFLFFQISLTEILILMNKVKTKSIILWAFQHHLSTEQDISKAVFSVMYVNQSSWKLSICKCVITSITVRATELYHKPNWSLCGFQPYIKLNLWFLWHIHYITFSQSRSIIGFCLDTCMYYSVHVKCVHVCVSIGTMRDIRLMDLH